MFFDELLHFIFAPLLLVAGRVVFFPTFSVETTLPMDCAFGAGEINGG